MKFKLKFGVLLFLFFVFQLNNNKVSAACTAPGAPTGLTATVGADCVTTLTWAVGTGTTVDSEIQICTNAGFTANCVTFSGETSPIEIGGFAAGTTYFYRIRGRNTGGAFECFSAYTTGSFATGGCVPPPDCGTCATACGTCGFATAPTVAQVTAGCPDYPYDPPIFSGQTDTRCHQFQAVATSVDFNVIIQSNCGAGNVTNFSWTLQNSTCGANLQTGLITDLNFTGLTIGNIYTFCYTYTVPSPAPFGCTETTHWPYFVGAQTVLPLELKEFEVVKLNKMNKLKWTTYSERDNDFFTIERMNANNEWINVAEVDGSGTSANQNSYHYEDQIFENQINYYRLSQTDINGVNRVLDTKVIDNRNELSSAVKRINMLGQEVQEDYRGLVFYIYENGEIVKVYQ